MVEEIMAVTVVVMVEVVIEEEVVSFSPVPSNSHAPPLDKRLA